MSIAITPPARIGPATGPATGATSMQRDQLREAAEQFEAVFLRQMLASARDSSIKSDLFDSSGADTFRQMRDDAFAEIASTQGVLGLADMIEAQVSRHMTRE